MEFTEQELLDIRTALITASCMADVALLAATGEERSTLDRVRWTYLQLAEKITAKGSN